MLWDLTRGLSGMGTFGGFLVCELHHNIERLPNPVVLEVVVLYLYDALMVQLLQDLHFLQFLLIIVQYLLHCHKLAI